LITNSRLKQNPALPPQSKQETHNHEEEEEEEEEAKDTRHKNACTSLGLGFKD
jgi:hypothetical protein